MPTRELLASSQPAQFTELPTFDDRTLARFYTLSDVFWNTVYLEQAVATLRAAGLEVPEDLLQHLSPLGWEHIVLTGEYRWTSDAERRPGQRRVLRLTPDAAAPLAG